MRKILALLGSISLITTSSISVISCDSIITGKPFMYHVKNGELYANGVRFAEDTIFFWISIENEPVFIPVDGKNKKHIYDGRYDKLDYQLLKTTIDEYWSVEKMRNWLDTH